MDNLDIYVRLVFDQILKGNTKESLDNFQKYRANTSEGYVVVCDAGGKEILSIISKIYGNPIEVFDYEERQKFQLQLHTEF